MAFFSVLRRASSSLLHKSLYLSSSSSSTTSFSRISSCHRFFSALFNQLVPDSSARAPVRLYTAPVSPPSLADPASEADDTITIEGWDFEHWLVIMQFPENPKPSEDEMVDTYINTLVAVVGRRFAC